MCIVSLVYGRYYLVGNIDYYNQIIIISTKLQKKKGSSNQKKKKSQKFTNKFMITKQHLAFVG